MLLSLIESLPFCSVSSLFISGGCFHFMAVCSSGTICTLVPAEDAVRSTIMNILRQRSSAASTATVAITSTTSTTSTVTTAVVACC